MPKPKFLFQTEDNDTKVESRSKDYPGRPVLNERERAVIKVILDGLEDKTDCSKPSRCLLPEEIQPHLGHGVAIIREKGSGNIERGLTRFRDQDKELEKIFTTKNKIIERVILVASGAFILWLLTKFGIVK